MNGDGELREMTEMNLLSVLLSDIREPFLRFPGLN
jgi:hypothetical protein